MHLQEYWVLQLHAGEVKYLASLSKMVEGGGYVGQKQSENVPRFIAMREERVLWNANYCFFLAAFLEIVMTAGGGKEITEITSDHSHFSLLLGGWLSPEPFQMAAVTGFFFLLLV